MPKGIKGFQKEHIINLGRKWSEETKLNMRKAALKRGITKENRLKMSIGKKGKPSPRIGVILSEEIKQKISKSKKGMPNGRLGKKHSKESKLKMSINNKGMKGLHHSEETKLRMSLSQKGRILTKEHIKKILKRRIPSSLENKFLNIIDKYNLPYKYVGNGSFLIEGYNPDFININGEKIAIEVYARYFKELNNKNIACWKNKRSEIFAKYGWKIIYLDETQINEECIKFIT